jgi:hypothetical protein
MPHGAVWARGGWPAGPKSAQFGLAAENPFFPKFSFLFPILVLRLQNSQIKYEKFVKNLVAP